MNGRSIRINRIPAGIAAIILIVILLYFVNTTQNNPNSIYGTMRNQNQIDLRKLLIGCIQAAQRGGYEVLQIANSRNLKERSKGKTDEGANDPFTEADGRSHCVMKEGLSRIFPRLTIFSEEDKETCSNVITYDLDPTVLHETAQIPNELVDIRDVNVWLDPLDATTEFTQKLYMYVTTMACVTVKGVPVIGVIHNPFNDETAWAWVGNSMSEYLTRIHTTNDNDLEEPIITVSRSHTGNAKDLIYNVFGEKSKILTAAGAGYKVLQLISNNATAYLHSTKIKKWDICAGDAILRHLGGVMTNLNDKKIDYGPNESAVNDNGLLATLNNHDNYMKKLSEYLKNKNIHDIKDQQKSTKNR